MILLSFYHALFWNVLAALVFRRHARRLFGGGRVALLEFLKFVSFVYVLTVIPEANLPLDSTETLRGGSNGTRPDPEGYDPASYKVHFRFRGVDRIEELTLDEVEQICRSRYRVFRFKEEQTTLRIDEIHSRCTRVRGYREHLRIRVGDVVYPFREVAPGWSRILTIWQHLDTDEDENVLENTDPTARIRRWELYMGRHFTFINGSREHQALEWFLTRRHETFELLDGPNSVGYYKMSTLLDMYENSGLSQLRSYELEVLDPASHHFNHATPWFLKELEFYEPQIRLPGTKTWILATVPMIKCIRSAYRRIG